MVDESKIVTPDTAARQPDEIDLEGLTPKIDKETFDRTVDVSLVTDQEFMERIKARRPDFSEANIARGRAYQYKDKDGRIKILIRREGMPEAYLPYVQEHETWEAYAASPDGYDLMSRARQDLKDMLVDRMPDITDENARWILISLANEYNFDYKHEYAILKEYQRAEREGRLDEYHAYILSLRQQDLVDYADDPAVMRKTQNDIDIRESIYGKVRNGTSHQFTKKITFG